MKVFYFIFTPITFIMDKITTFLMSYFVPKKLRNKEKKSALSSIEDITTIINLGHKAGIIKGYTHDLLTGVMDFRNKTAEEIMTPRVDMVCIEADTDIDEIMRLTVDTGLSRFPVYEETIDHIIGIFHTRALFKDYIKNNGKPSKMKKKAIDYIMLPILYSLLSSSLRAPFFFCRRSSRFFYFISFFLQKHTNEVKMHLRTNTTIHF